MGIYSSEEKQFAPRKDASMIGRRSTGRSFCQLLMRLRDGDVNRR